MEISQAITTSSKRFSSGMNSRQIGQLIMLISVFVLPVASDGKAGLTESEQKNQTIEIASEIGDIPPLVITLPPNVTHSYQPGVFVETYTFKKMVHGKDTATMQIVVAGVEGGLKQAWDVVGGHKFTQTVATFFYERSAWFSWIVRGKLTRRYSMAYLYNVFPESKKNATPYVVEIFVWGQDPRAIEELKTAAQGFGFKGLGNSGQAMNRDSAENPQTIGK